jgi:hypothetical protein
VFKLRNPGIRVGRRVQCRTPLDRLARRVLPYLIERRREFLRAPGCADYALGVMV